MNLRRMTLAIMRVAILMPAIAVPCAHAQDAWRTQPGPETRFTVEMPSAPQYKQVPVATPSGAKYGIHQYALKDGDQYYLVQAMVYPAEVKMQAPRTLVQAGLDQEAGKLDGGKWANVIWSTPQESTAVDADGIKGPHDVRFYSTLKGRLQLVLIYAGPRGTARGRAIDSAIASNTVNRAAEVPALAFWQPPSALMRATKETEHDTAVSGAFSGKVESGFPSENATMQES